MDDSIDRILRNSNKADLIEALGAELAEADAKVVVILVVDRDDGKYSSTVMTLGLKNTYEAYGILDVARHDLMEEDC